MAAILRGQPEVVDVFLFGSLARQDATAQSDIDLAVIVEGDKNRRMTLDVAWQELLESLSDAPFDLVVFWLEEVENSRLAVEGVRI